MNKDLTKIVVVLDCSGSMSSCKNDTEQGLRYFIEQQKEKPGKCVLSLYEFDNRYRVVYDSVPLEFIEKSYSFHPAGGTALLDALGTAIEQTGKKLAETPEQDRPGLVVFVVLTDGEENSSRSFSNEKVREMIKHQQDVYKWQFTFLGADQDSFANAGQLGFKHESVANFSKDKMLRAYQAVDNNIGRMRSMSASHLDVDSYYTKEEKEDII